MNPVTTIVLSPADIREQLAAAAALREHLPDTGEPEAQAYFDLLAAEGSVTLTADDIHALLLAEERIVAHLPDTGEPRARAFFDLMGRAHRLLIASEGGPRDVERTITTGGPKVEIVSRRGSLTRPDHAIIASTSDWIEPHRESNLLDAVFAACDEIGVDTEALGLIARIYRATDHDAPVADRLVEAYERLDTALSAGVQVITDDGRVRLVVGVKGCSVVAEQADTSPGSAQPWGWRITGKRRSIAA